MSETFSTQFLYRGGPDSLREVYDALEANDGVDMDDDRDTKDFEYSSRIFYSEPFSSAIYISELLAGIPRSDAEVTDLRLRIHQSKASFLEDDLDLEVEAEACQSHIDLTKYLYETLPTRPALVCSTSPNFGAGGIAPLPDLDENGNIAYPRPFITWLDIYPPAEVETIGREKLLSAPAPRAEELDDGSVLIASKHPLEIGEGHFPEVSDHLGIPDWADLLYDD